MKTRAVVRSLLVAIAPCVWLFGAACGTEDPIIHNPPAPEPPPYDGARVLAWSEEAPDYLVVQEAIELSFRLTGDGIGLPYEHLELAQENMTEGNTASGTAKPGPGPNAGADPVLRVVTDADGWARCPVAAGTLPGSLRVRIRDLCERCTEGSPAADLDVVLPVRRLAVGQLDVGLRTAVGADCDRIDVWLYRRPLLCAPERDTSGQAVGIWLDPEAPPAGALQNASGACAADSRVSFADVTTGSGYAVLAVASRGGQVQAAACRDGATSEPITISRDTPTRLDLTLRPLLPDFAGTYAATVRCDGWRYAPEWAELASSLRRMGDDPDDPARFVVERLDDYFSWGLNTFVTAHGALDDRTIAAVAAAMRDPAPWLRPDIAEALAGAAEVAEGLDSAPLSGLQLAGALRLRPMLPDGSAYGALALDTWRLPTGTDPDPAATERVEGEPAAEFLLRVELKDAAFVSASARLEFERLALGLTLERALRTAFWAPWAQRLGGAVSDPVAETLWRLFLLSAPSPADAEAPASCAILVEALDRADCPPDGEGADTVCAHDGFWAGTTRYARYELEAGCLAVVQAETARINALLLTIRDAQPMALAAAGILRLEPCPGTRAVCGLVAAPSLAMEAPTALETTALPAVELGFQATRSEGDAP